MQRFGEKLRTLRLRRGMTLRELAEALGYTAHGHISEMESGKRIPKVSLVLKVATLFGVSMDQLTRDDLDLDVGSDDAANIDEKP